MIKIGQLNVRSYKYAQILQLLQIEKIDILILIETWFKLNVDYPIPSGYNVYRADRDGLGGGIAVLVREQFKCSKVNVNISNFKKPTSIEHLTISVQVEFNKTFFVSAIYFPNKDNFSNNLSNLNVIIDKLNTFGSKFFIL